ncbi:hypothetical protein [Nocardia abscessus]|uniref:hypothetical protein n=1 Tax=Nocardia abscessus TaxID=120957 RepID=UPI0024557AE4|nr:hypothetical protein [Nocardia abscessus]
MHIDFYGKAVEACGPLDIRMTVNMRVELSAIPAESKAHLDPTSSSSPGALHQFVKINHWKNDLDAALCLVGAKAIWPYLGPKLMIDEHLTWFELVTSFLMPPTTTYFLLAFSNKGGLAPSPGPECVRPDPEKDEFTCTRPLNADSVAFGGRPLLIRMQALPSGMVLHGITSWFERLGRDLRLSSIVVRPFQLDGNRPSCNGIGPAGLALRIEHPESFVVYSAAVDVAFEPAPLYDGAHGVMFISTRRTPDALIEPHICAARVRPDDDPLNVFAPYVTVDTVVMRVVVRVEQPGVLSEQSPTA